MWIKKMRPVLSVRHDLWHKKLSRICILLAALLAGCSNPVVSANLIGYNHTDSEIAYFNASGTGGGYLAAGAGGGSFTCCVSLPSTWRPGLQVKIGWMSNDLWQEEVVTVPKYTEVGNLDVHFLRRGGVKVFSTKYALWHEDYPLKGEEAQMVPGKDPQSPWNR